MKIFFYNCPPAIESVNTSPGLVPHTLYYAKLVRYLKRFEVFNPHDADFFFIPLNLIKFQFSTYYPDPGVYIETLPYLHLKPHLLFASGDFGQRKKSIYENHATNRVYPDIYPWLDHRFILLAFESTDDLLPQDIATLPFVLKEGRPSPWRSFFNINKERDLLYSFVGAVSYPELSADHIRGGCLNELKDKGKKSFIGSPQEALSRYGKGQGNIITLFHRSLFSLCPAGYGRWTFRLLEALKYGAIPVVLSDGYQFPFAATIPWDKICLKVAENDLANVPSILSSMPKEAIEIYQKNRRKYIHLFSEKTIYSLITKELVLRNAYH